MLADRTPSFHKAIRSCLSATPSLPTQPRHLAKLIEERCHWPAVWSIALYSDTHCRAVEAIAPQYVHYTGLGVFHAQRRGGHEQPELTLPALDLLAILDVGAPNSVLVDVLLPLAFYRCVALLSLLDLHVFACT